MTIERRSSSIGEVSEIRNACPIKRNLCRMLKAGIFIACLTGFGYQTEEFLTNFYKYPTVLNMAMEKLQEFPTPSLTFCSSYLFDFDKYCSMYSDRCKSSKEMEPFCLNHPRNCGGNAADAIMPIQFPKRYDAYIDDFALNVSDVFSYSLAGQDFQGPFFYSNHFTAFDQECYRLGSGLAATGLRNITTEGTRKQKWGEIDIFFAQRENIYFNDADQPFGILHIHSPFISSRKFTKSTTIKAGYDYKVYLRLEAESLLPFPYETNCEDYVASWERNNMTGPLSRDMCEHVCIQDESTYFEYGFFEDAFGFYEDFCDENEGSKAVREGTICQCWKKCKDECLKLNYNFRAFPTTLQKREQDHNKAKVTVYIDSNKVQFTHHRPQYRDEELFSYIGGLLGCWLGISIWALSEILYKGYSVLEIHMKNYRKVSNRRDPSKNVL